MPTAGARLELRGLAVVLGATRAVDGLDLTVEAGDIAAVLGPSGSGKTTLLRAIAGLVRPDAGTVVIDGEDQASTPVHRRGIGLMFQDQALFPHRDVGGNVAFGLRMRGERGAAVIDRVADVLRLVGLAGFERRAIGSLSGGEQQRVALARALAPSPRLLLLDEPLGALDRALRDRLVVELGDLLRSQAVTSVLVTHDQGEAFTLADRVVLMRAGRAVQEGRPHEVWARPVDATAARFLGATNVVSGELTGGALDTPIGHFPAPGMAEGRAVAVIRPAAITVGSLVAGRLAGSVRRVVFAGDHVVVTIATDAGPVLDATVATGAPEVGDRVSLAIDPSGAVVVPT